MSKLRYWFAYKKSKHADFKARHPKLCEAGLMIPLSILAILAIVGVLYLIGNAFDAYMTARTRNLGAWLEEYDPKIGR
jgi:hypothetical protein